MSTLLCILLLIFKGIGYVVYYLFKGIFFVIKFLFDLVAKWIANSKQSTTPSRPTTYTPAPYKPAAPAPYKSAAPAPAKPVTPTAPAPAKPATPIVTPPQPAPIAQTAVVKDEEKPMTTASNAVSDQGYLSVTLKKADGKFYLCPMSINEKEDETRFFVDYENGTIFVDFQNGSPKEIIGYYEQQITNPVYGAKVYDSTKTKVIGRVGNELIHFVKQEANPSMGRYSAEEKCLAHYTASGNITTLKGLPFVGHFFGSEIGGAAAFVATFHAYNFQSVYLDYLEMETKAFEKKHRDYPLFGW